MPQIVHGVKLVVSWLLQVLFVRAEHKRVVKPNNPEPRCKVQQAQQLGPAYTKQQQKKKNFLNYEHKDRNNSKNKTNKQQKTNLSDWWRG